MVRALRETKRQVEELQATQAGATLLSGSASGSTEKAAMKLVSVVDANIVNKIGTFSGCDEDWAPRG